MRKEEVRELIDELEAEINNGGFDQFFFNSSGDNTLRITQALKLIGASHTAEILEKAASKFPEGLVPTDRDMRQEILEVISPDSDAFKNEDEQFFEYVDNLIEMVSSYEHHS